MSKAMRIAVDDMPRSGDLFGRVAAWRGPHPTALALPDTPCDEEFRALITCLRRTDDASTCELEYSRLLDCLGRAGLAGNSKEATKKMSCTVNTPP